MSTILPKADSIPAEADYAARTERLIAKIESFPQTKHLYDFLPNIISSKYDATGPWKVEFDASMTSPAKFRSWSRKILLNPSCDELTNLSTLIFEMINIIDLPEFDRLESLAREGKIGKEDFAKEIVKLEFDSSLSHHRVLSAAIRTMNWPQSMDFFAKYTTLTFEEFWKEWQFQPHAQIYRDFWETVNPGKFQPSVSVDLITPSCHLDIHTNSEEGALSVSISRFEILDLEDDSTDETLIELSESNSNDSIVAQ